MKSLITQVENSKKILTSRMYQTEVRISDLEDKIEDLDQIWKEYEILNKIQEGNTQKLWDMIGTPNLWIIAIDEGEESNSMA